MNVASLELCKQLYELSGWVPTGKTFVWANSPVEDEHGDFWTVHHTEMSLSIGYGTYNFPAYDLGYLLRKLPYRMWQDPDIEEQFSLTKKATEWEAGYIWIQTKLADTPEDAAAKLAIELFKQGVLTR